MPRFTGPIVRRDTSPGVHVRALYEALATFQWLLYSDSSPGARKRKLALQAHMDALHAAYKEHFATESDVAQILAEEDGDAVQDEGP